MSSQPANQNYDADPVSPELRARYVANRISVLWESPNGAIGGPSDRMQGWAWRDLQPMIMETAKITLPAIIERRVMQLVDPTASNAGAEGTSGLINGAVQALMPGEHARPHRHSMNALRFILEGRGAETVVNGKPCLMEGGDLVITPGWTWHEHRNAGGEATVWVDILDAVLHRAFGTAVFQPGPIQNPRAAIADAAFTSGAFVPVAAQADPQPYSPMFRYPWADAKRAVEAAPPAADGSRTIRYADPVNGGPVLPTLDCYLQQIEAGATTTRHRSSASAICVVVEGTGETRSGDDSFAWGPKDIFTLPQHAWSSHRCTDGPARIFITTNREVYRRLGLLVEESA